VNNQPIFPRQPRLHLSLLSAKARIPLNGFFCERPLRFVRFAHPASGGGMMKYWDHLRPIRLKNNTIHGINEPAYFILKLTPEKRTENA